LWSLRQRPGLSGGALRRPRRRSCASGSCACALRPCQRGRRSRRLARRAQLRSRLDAQAEQIPAARHAIEESALCGGGALAESVAAHAEAIVELRELLRQPQRPSVDEACHKAQVAQSADIAGLRGDLEQLRSRMDAQAEQLPAARHIVEEPTGCSGGTLAESVAANAEAIVELREQLRRPSCLVAPADGSPDRPGSPGHCELAAVWSPRRGAWTGALALESNDMETVVELRELRGRCDALQELVEQKVLVSVWQVDRQLPDVVERMDRLQCEYTECAGTLQEHDVRLNLALSRLSTNEEKGPHYLA